VPAPGGAVTYHVKVRNEHPGGMAVTVDRMHDNVYGNLTNPGNRNISNSTCKLVTIQPGDTYQCTFDAQVAGSPGSSVTDTVTVRVTDANGNRLEASAQATVKLGAGGAPQIEVAKVPKPDEVPAEGGTVTYQVKVRNKTSLVLTLLRMHDNLYGNLTNPGNTNISNSTCELATIQGGDTYQCTFDARVTGSPGSSVTDVVTVRAEDPSGVRVEDSAQATVRIGPAKLPQIAVSKSADPKQILDPGGTITYRVRVRNESPGAVTLTGIHDNLYGNLTDSGNSLIANSTCGLVSIPRGDTYNCTFKAQVTGIAGSTVIDIVRVRAEDAAGNKVEASAEAKVEIVGKPPPTGVPLPPPAIFGSLLGLGLAALLGGALMHGRSLRPG
jgi:uncharacterized repeat protein (TIGR01451 family)